MTRNELTRRFPKASEAFIKANLDIDFAAPFAELERHPRHEPLAAQEVQRSNGQRFLVRVTSRRKRLLDEDNLCSKYLVDLCRYAGVIPDDAPDQVGIETRQIKTQKTELEITIIEVFEL